MTYCQARKRFADFVTTNLIREQPKKSVSMDLSWMGEQCVGEKTEDDYAEDDENSALDAMKRKDKRQRG